MQTRRALLASLGVGLAGCGTTRREMDPETAPPPMDYEPGTPSTPTPRSSPLAIDESFRWPAPYYDATNAVRVPSTGPREEPVRQWEAWLPDVTAARNALIDGEWLYVFGRRRVAVLDRRTGQLTRSVRLPLRPRTAPSLADAGVVVGATTEDRSPGIALVGTVGERYWLRDEGTLVLPPVLADETVVNSRDGVLLGRSVADGKVTWRHDAHKGNKFVTMPAVADGTVYVQGSRECYAVDLASGERRWRSETGAERSPATAVSVGPEYAYVGFEDGPSTVAYDRGTGAVAWEADGAAPVGTHAVGAERVVTASAAGRVVARSRDDGKTRWSARGAAGRPILAGDAVYVRGGREGDETERVVALSLADGTRRWERPVDGGGWLLAADGYCYLNRGEGAIQCLG